MHQLSGSTMTQTFSHQETTPLLIIVIYVQSTLKTVIVTELCLTGF